MKKESSFYTNLLSVLRNNLNETRLSFLVNVRPSIGFAGEFRMVGSIPQPPVAEGAATRDHQIGRDAQMEAMLKSEGPSSRKKTWDNYLGFHASL